MKVDITVGEAVPVKENPQDCYVVEIFLMHGDADNFTYFKVGPFAQATQLSAKHGDLASVLEFIRQAADLKQTDRRRAREAVRDLEGWPMFESLWETDNTDPDGERLALYDTHRVRYFDEHGKEFVTTYSLSAI